MCETEKHIFAQIKLSLHVLNLGTIDWSIQRINGITFTFKMGVSELVKQELCNNKCAPEISSNILR